jgi:hypothetical protein
MNTVDNLISEHVDYTFIFCEDFNLPGIEWSYEDSGFIYSTKGGSRIHCEPETLAFNNFF